MKRRTIWLAFVLSMGIVCVASGTTPRIAFIYMGDNGPFTEPGLEFAERTFNTTLLTREELASVDLTQFAVV